MVVVVAVLLFVFFTWLLFTDSGVAVIMAFLLISFGLFAFGIFVLVITALAKTIVNQF
ncbi:hypothetical protein ACFPYN_14010 [Paenisporosarcina macmurdoensis]|uniref:Uncharacterized protein n=1 Tax=Paenisporosarcina macmurdoensis TaxID=212659 RepID=A0ABW1LC06_9BACL